MVPIRYHDSEAEKEEKSKTHDTTGSCDFQVS